MIKRPELLALEFYKSRPFKGSDKGIRYMIQKDTVPVERDSENQDEDGETETKTVLTAFIWPEPFCFSKTAPEKKIQKEFPLTPEGKEEAVSWLNEIYQLEFA